MEAVSNVFEKKKQKEKKSGLIFTSWGYLSGTVVHLQLTILSVERSLDVYDWAIFTKAKSIYQTKIFCKALKNRRFKLKNLCTWTSWKVIQKMS